MEAFDSQLARFNLCIPKVQKPYGLTLNTLWEVQSLIYMPRFFLKKKLYILSFANVIFIINRGTQRCFIKGDIYVNSKCGSPVLFQLYIFNFDIVCHYQI